MAYTSAAPTRTKLYWPAQADDPSPLGELVAGVTTEGYAIGGGRTPFHGYYFKVLGQGPMAEGGAVDNVVNGKMIGGFALVAYSAEYGNSGVMIRHLRSRRTSGTARRKSPGA